MSGKDGARGNAQKIPERERGHMNIRKVVIPVAGWGTRSLPASKNIPKEMLPVYNKPVVQYVVEEAIRAGVEDVIFVTNRDKSVIEDHFDYNLQLEGVLERAGKLQMLKEVRDVAEMVNIMSVRQKKQLGLGHAVLCAKEMVRAVRTRHAGYRGHGSARGQGEPLRQRHG